MKIFSLRTARACRLIAAALAIAAGLGADAAEPVAAPKRLTTVVSVDGIYSPDGRKIAFASNRLGNDPETLAVWLMDADGKNPHPLTAGKVNDEMPAISPDGRRLAFMSNRDGNLEIYVMNLDGSDTVRLTNHPANDIHPQWTPDGTEVIFNSSRDTKEPNGAEVFEIYAVKPDGTGFRQITHDGAVSTYAAMSPDGQKIVYRKLTAGNSEVFVCNADGSGEANLTNGPAFDGWPAWSPDSKRIVFASNRGSPADVYEIFVMNSDGSNPMALTDLKARSTAPVFSPDGRTILFTRGGKGFAELFTIPAP